MEILKDKTSKAYMINITDSGVYKLCKVLNEYSSQAEANVDLVGLLTNKKTEKEILKDYSKKDII